MAIFHLHVSPEARRQKIQSRINDTHALAEMCLHGPVQPKQLSKLGIHAVQVSLLKNDLFKFKPCFFLPAPAQTIRTCLRAKSHDELQNAVSDDEKTDSRGSSDSSISRTLVTQYSLIVDSRCDKLPTAIRSNLFLDNLSSLRECGATSKGKWRYQPDLELSNHEFDTDHWEILHLFEDAEHELSHIIFDLRQDLDVDKTEYLTAGEIKAILRVMTVRMGLACYHEHVLMPILVVSYLNSKQGRILQAHHDGRSVIIQYTPLFNFGGLAYGPVELFLRYYCSRPAGIAISK
ncbi:hypothetical protein BO70DRAFT_185761 [Aspergillus heteromorphus CBS 117.55]|uniref:Uncharacterized protein n=1 Tax=Aspergillus heteromorphus CBS 117.55 TaxID=1448321 RepID=A0A317V074_9EURO|nr:uncharacterized protein BO70DRAFT_185761 [Aspergillus heteromorphus CBS 117.55]PWY65590.1 hypothetical protein BO70DRAFT_185761 [Aspergillus heteromorphus CBS 117.55]